MEKNSMAKKKKYKTYRTQKRMPDINSTVSIKTLNVNELNSPIKRQILLDLLILKKIRKCTILHTLYSTLQVQNTNSLGMRIMKKGVCIVAQ